MGEVLLKIAFVTFGDGSVDFKEAATRISLQAKSLGIFDEIFNFDSLSLKKTSPVFASFVGLLPELDSYPLYFRACKAFAIEAIINYRNDYYDVIVYADPGCEIVSNSVSRKVLRNMIKSALETNGLAERLVSSEIQYSKRFLLEYLSATDSEKKSGQIQATFSILVNNDLTRKLVASWCELSDPKLDLWQKPKNLNLESDNFIEHRYDQSIFSILWKRFNFGTVNVTRNYNTHLDILRGACQPIHTIRNRSGKFIIPRFYGNNLIAIFGFCINKFFEFFKQLSRNNEI